MLGLPSPGDANDTDKPSRGDDGLDDDGDVHAGTAFAVANLSPAVRSARAFNILNIETTNGLNHAWVMHAGGAPDSSRQNSPLDSS